MRQRKPRFIITSPSLEEKPPVTTPPGTVPESQLVQELLKKEKEIAADTIQMLRSRYENERRQWTRLLEEKEREILVAKAKSEDNESRLKKVRDEYRAEKVLVQEQMETSARALESIKADQKRKWELLAEEVRQFRDAADKAQEKWSQERTRVEKMKEQLRRSEELHSEKLHEKDEDIAKMKEQALVREAATLQEKSQADQAMHALEERLAAVQKTLEDERLYQQKSIEKRDNEIGSLQKSLQETIFRLNDVRQKATRFEECLLKKDQELQQSMDDIKKIKEQAEKEKIDIASQWKERQAQREKEIESAQKEEEAQKKDKEEKLQRLQKSLELLEQQRADENAQHQDILKKLNVKIEGLESAAVQKDAVVAEWRVMIEKEKENVRAQLAELRSEYEKLLKEKDAQISVVQTELHGLKTEHEELRHVYSRVNDEKKELEGRCTHLSESERMLREQGEQKERAWAEESSREQKALQHYGDELKREHEAALMLRDQEIQRLSETLAGTQQQITELRQKISEEKAEQNIKSCRIQELESQIKGLQLRAEQESAAWENKIQIVQAQWDKYRKDKEQFETDIEQQYQKDIQLYREKIKRLQAKISEQAIDRPAPRSATPRMGENKTPPDTSA